MVKGSAPSLASKWKPSEFGLIPSDWDVFEAFTFDPFITSGSRGWAKYYSDSGAPFIRITNLSHEDIHPNLTDLRFVALPKDEVEARRTQLELGDVLISITADIGAIGFVGPEVPRPAYINQHIACLRLPRAMVDSKYVAYFLASDVSQRRFAALLDVGAKTGLNLTTVGKLKLLCPPQPEQVAIAEALSDADALTKSLETLIAKKRAIKQGAMQDLLSRRRRLPGFTTHWERRTLDELCVKIQDGTHFSPKLGGIGYLYVTSKNIGKGFLDLSSVETISAEEHAKIFARCDPRRGDLLLTKDGASTGNAAINSIDQPISLLSSVAMLRFAPRCHCAEFYLQQVLSDEGQKQIKNLMSGNAITRLTLAKIRALEFEVPTFEEQQAIALALSDMDTEIRTLEERLAKARQIKRGMMEELLTGRVRLV